MYGKLNKFRLDCSVFQNSFGFLVGLIGCSAIGFKDKVRFIYSLFHLLNKKSADMLLDDFFIKNRYSEEFIKRIWMPTIFAIMNAPIDKVVVEIFQNTIKYLFKKKKSPFSLNHNLVPLSNLFEPFFNKIIENGQSTISMNSPVTDLIYCNEICKGVVVSDNVKHHCDYVISTLPPKNLSLISEKFNHLNEVFPSSALLSIHF